MTGLCTAHAEDKNRLEAAKPRHAPPKAGLYAGNGMVECTYLT